MWTYCLGLDLREDRVTLSFLSLGQIISSIYDVPHRKLIKEEDIYPTPYPYQFPHLRSFLEGSLTFFNL